MDRKNYILTFFCILGLLILIGTVEKCRNGYVFKSAPKEISADKPIMNVEPKIIEETPEQIRAGYLGQIEAIRKELVLMDEANTRHSISEVSDMARKFSNMGSTLAMLQRNVDTAVSVKASQMIKELKARQKKDFPVLRKNYIKWANDEAWENNMYITGSGTTINFRWHGFASNKNIKDFQNKMDGPLRDLRFKRVVYMWYKDQDDYTYYDLGSRGDGDL